MTLLKKPKAFSNPLLLFTILLTAGCSGVSNQFSDENLRQIADLQDRRSTDSLVTFLSHPNPLYRESAAMALGSVQDSTSALPLGNALLDDENPGVRAAAAFALGQTGSFAAVNALIPAMGDVDPTVRFEVRVALGKTIKVPDVASLISDDRTDSSSTRGLAWGIFQLGSRRLADSAVVDKALALLQTADEETQLGAAHFFSRSVYPPNQTVKSTLIQTTLSPNPEIRMAAVSALRKYIDQESLNAITRCIESDADYRVRINGVRALQSFDWEEAAHPCRLALADDNERVVVAAAESLRQRKGYSLSEITSILSECRNWRASAVLTEILLGLDPSAERINSIDLSGREPYQLAALIDALGNAPASYPKIVEHLFSSEEKVVLSTAASALVKINRNPAFTADMQREFADIYQRAIAGGDQGVILYVCDALADSALGYKKVISDVNFLRQAKDKLSLPRDYETLLPLERAIAWFEGRPAPAAPATAYNHPIDWKLAKTIDSRQKVNIRTTRGDITMQLFVNEAPGSVVNFVRLATSEYFDGKFVHRVVPNFVIQAGCNRGDGFGSEDYSIRSEFSRRRYKTGSVGMASAGKDTEGTQWFITHSPTPHLDGRYTIFAEVVDGQSVVDAIDVGDQILSVSLADN